MRILRMPARTSARRRPRSLLLRILVFAAIVVTWGGGALLASGCSGNGRDSADPGGPIEIVLWEMMDPDERGLLVEHLEAFEASHPGVTVTRTHFGVEDLRTQFLTAALGGGGPDVVYGPSDNIGPFSIAGRLRPLEPLFGREFFERFHPLTQDRVGGELWAVPEQFGNHLVFVVNRALVPEIPKTVDDMLRIARENTIDQDGDGVLDRYGIVFETKEPFWLVPWLGGYGGWVMTEDAVPTLDSPAMVEALAFIRSLKSEHRVIPQDCDYELSDTLFKEGRAAMTINGPWSWMGYRNAGIDIALAPIPEIPGRGWPAPMVSYRGYSINRACAERKLPMAKALIEHLTSEATQRAFAETIGSLPSLVALQEDAMIREDPVLAPSMEQVRHGRRMPVVPEMRAIWDVMRPAYQNVMNGEMTPKKAAATMQTQAVRKIEEMRR